MRRTLLLMIVLGLVALFSTGCPKKQTTPIEEGVSLEEGFGGTEPAPGGVAKLPEETMPSQQEPFREEPLEEGAEGGTMGARGLDLSTVFFDFDSDALSPEAMAILEANAAWLRAHPGTRILLEGHTDERGTLEYNLALGQRRANSVKNHLVRIGVAVDQLDTITFGEERPADPGHDEAAWARNRRCEFTEAP